MEYLLHILILIDIYILLAVSLNLIVGYAGLLSVTHAAFYGVGAYVAALMALKLHSPFLANIVCAVILNFLLVFNKSDGLKARKATVLRKFCLDAWTAYRLDRPRVNPLPATMINALENVCDQLKSRLGLGHPEVCKV